jgi:cysteine desulfurase/selenocysteine lyase
VTRAIAATQQLVSFCAAIKIEPTALTMAIYLDNAATTFPKPETVYQAIDRTLRQLGVNPGRGSYQLALDAGRLVLEVREAVADFFQIPDASRIIFTANATEAINLALFGLLQPGDRVVISTMEHNAVSRPFHVLASRGVEVLRVPADGVGRISPSAIQEASTTGGCRARMVVLTHCSNITGTIRVSPGLFNSSADIDTLLTALEQIAGAP